MANKFVTAIFGDYSKKEVKKVKKTADKVLALEEKYASMSDKELTSQTDILKGRLANGETLDDILPDAFAVCREGAWRVLGMKHFPVQIIGGIVLHQGRIAEMKTGEGKHLLLLFRFILTLSQARVFILLRLTIILQSVTQSGWVSFIVSSA